MRYLLILLCISFLTACAQSTNYYTPTVSSWQGGNINTLVDRWGKPDGRAKMTDGNIAYFYQTASRQQAGGSNSPQVGVNYNMGGRPSIVTQNTSFAASRGGISYNCLTTFISSTQGKILRVTEEGTGCYGNATFARDKSSPDQK